MTGLAYQQLQNIAKQLQRETPGLTPAQALDQAIQAHPALYGDVRQEERHGVAQTGVQKIRKVVTTPAPDAGNRAWLVIQKRAQARVATGEVATFAQAVDAVVREDPDLYRDYKAIRTGGK